MLKRYSILAFVVLSVEMVLLFLFRTPLKDVDRVPQTFEEVVFSAKVFSASLFPDLFSSSEKKKEIHKSTVSIKRTMLEQKLISAGLVNIKDVDSSIVVNLKYSTDDNFLHKNLYGALKNCYLQKEIAEKSKAELGASKKWGSPIVTDIIPAKTFWRAEEYHQQYFAKNNIKGTCHF